MVDKNSWFKIYRSIIDSNVFENPEILKVWIWVMCKANFKESDPIIGNQKIHLEPGQMIFGRNSASLELQMSPSKCYRIMNLLKDCGNIDLKPNNKFSVVTVLNWGVYQSKNINSEQQVNSKRTASEQQVNSKRTHYNNTKNNRIIRSSSSELPPPTQNDIISFASENNLTNVDCVQFFTYYDAAGWKTKKGEPITDWKSSLIRWNKTEKVKPKENPKSFAAYDIDLFEKMLNEDD